MDYLYFVFATLIFVAVVLLIEGVYVAWNSSKGPEAQRLMRRVQAMSSTTADKTAVSITKKRVESASPILERLMATLPHAARLERLLAQSGKQWTVGGFAAGSLAAALAAWAAAVWFALPFPLQLASAALALSPTVSDANVTSVARSSPSRAATGASENCGSGAPLGRPRCDMSTRAAPWSTASTGA